MENAIIFARSGLTLCNDVLEWSGLRRRTAWERSTVLDQLIDGPVNAAEHFPSDLFSLSLLRSLFTDGPWSTFNGLLVLLGVRRAHDLERPRPLDHLVSSPLHAIMPLVYHAFVYLHSRQLAPPAQPAPNPIAVVCISDTFSDRAGPPLGDLLIHTGNISYDGTRASIQEEIDWLSAQPHQHKVFVSGPHDRWFDENARKPEDQDSPEVVDFRTVVHLNDSSVRLNFGPRSVNIYGAPDVPETGLPHAANEYARNTQHWNMKVPDETNILVTHAAPAHHLDLGIGCASLLEENWRVKPQLHVFGHVTWGFGIEYVTRNGCQRAYERLMSRPKKGILYDLLPNMGWLDAVAMIYHGLSITYRQYRRPEAATRDMGIMTNAAQRYGDTGETRNYCFTVVF